MTDEARQLARHLSQLQVRRGYLDVYAGVSRAGGPFVRAEGLHRLTQHLGAFAYAQWDKRDARAVAGVSIQW